MIQQNRRNFLKKATVLTGSALLAANQNKLLSQAVAKTVRLTRSVEVYVNQYMVGTFYAREGINLAENPDRCFAEMKEAGIAGFEAMATHPKDFDVYIDALAKQNMQLRSLYTNGNLHDKEASENEIRRVLALAERAKPAGTKMITLNPEPKSGKSDEELERQNKNFDLLGAELRKSDMKLALHYHTVELEYAAREFHSFMCDTDPENVSLCFDVHWSFRASGNSAVSAYNHAKLYADRVSVLHLRQSQNGIWTETFMSEGDIDYHKTLAILRKYKESNDYHIVLEQAPEKGTPKTLRPIDIFKQSVEVIQKLFQ